MKNFVIYLVLLLLLSINGFTQCQDIRVYNGTDCDLTIKVHYYYDNDECSEEFIVPAQTNNTIIPGYGNSPPCPDNNYCIGNFTISAPNCTPDPLAFYYADTGDQAGPFTCSCAGCTFTINYVNSGNPLICILGVNNNN